MVFETFWKSVKYLIIQFLGFLNAFPDYYKQNEIVLNNGNRTWSVIFSNMGLELIANWQKIS